jgi:hypothetical protein
MPCETDEVDQVTQALSLPPGPGIYPGIPAENYHAWDLASSHRLSVLATETPAHMRHAVDHPKEPTPDFVLGSALHALVLEPGTFSSLYAVAGQCEATTKKGSRCSYSGTVCRAGEWFCNLHDPGATGQGGGRTPLTEKQYAAVIGMRDAISRHPAASDLIDGYANSTSAELSAVWTCRDTGVGCKMRVDLVNYGVRTCVDIKTCASASRAAFERAIFDYGYYRQGAHYLRGFSAHKVDVDTFANIAVEKTPPHAVAVYRLQDDVLGQGDLEVVRLLDLYGRCQRERRWPAYSDKVQDIGIPAWAFQQLVREQ